MHIEILLSGIQGVFQQCVIFTNNVIKLSETSSKINEVNKSANAMHLKTICNFVF